jgi:tRNA G18 (ribose-2'-O)-methylase SpoU
VGAIFRTADAFGISKLHLCGITPTPENASVAKTALGADRSVGWGHNKNALVLAETLKAQGSQLWALEQDTSALSIYAIEPAPNYLVPNHPITLIVGNEVTGVDPGLLELCDKILYIPMRGEKRSLNVEVAFGVAVSWLVR